MAVNERNKDIHMVSELLLIHLPETLEKHDDKLCKDICAVIAINLKRIDVDVDKSATAWEKRDYFMKADELRREFLWLPTARQLAEQLAYAPQKFEAADLKRLGASIPNKILELLQKPRFKNIDQLRGAAAQARATVLKP